MLTDIRPHEGFFYYAIGVYTSKRQESLLLCRLLNAFMEYEQKLMSVYTMCSSVHIERPN